MFLGATYSPTVPVGGATSYKLWPVLTYSNGIFGKVQTFSGGFFRLKGGGGWEEGDMLGELSLEEFVMGEEKFHEGRAGFSSIC